MQEGGRGHHVLSVVEHMPLFSHNYASSLPNSTVHKSLTPGRPGDYTQYGGAQRLESSVWHLLHVTLLAPGTVMWRLDFQKMCAFLVCLSLKLIFCLTENNLSPMQRFTGLLLLGKNIATCFKKLDETQIYHCVTETQNFQMLQQYYRCNSALKH